MRPRPARPLQRAQPDHRPVCVRCPGGQVCRRHAWQRDRADLPAQPGQQVHQRPDPQEAARVRQRRRRGQVIARVGFPRPLRHRAQRRRSRLPGHQRPRQLYLHRQPQRDLPRSLGRHPGQRRIQQRRREHRRRQPQARPLPHRPRHGRDPGRRHLLRRPRRLRCRRARQRPAHHDPPARPGELQQPPAGVLPDRRHCRHLGKPRRRIPRDTLHAAARRHHTTSGTGYRRSRKHRRAPRKRQVQEPPMLPHTPAYAR